ncbi:MAG: hypothetical protein ACREON_17870, partial [Gemmatimonadaceae bacterium]
MRGRLASTSAFDLERHILMNIIEHRPLRGGSRAGSLAGIVALVVALPLTGCSDLLEVENPNIILPENLSGPAALSAQYVGALGEFTGGYAGGFADGSFAISVVTASALVSDETYDTDQFQE